MKSWSLKQKHAEVSQLVWDVREFVIKRNLRKLNYRILTNKLKELYKVHELEELERIEKEIPLNLNDQKKSLAPKLSLMYIFYIIVYMFQWSIY